MDIKDMLNLVKSGEMEIQEAEQLLKDLPYADLGYAKLDHHRVRCWEPGPQRSNLNW